MGTFVEVISTDARAGKIAFDEISRVEGLLSKYRPESEVWRLNKAGTLKVSPETFALVKACKDYSVATGGAFDISVGALMDAWGFSDKKYREPPAQEIESILTRVGSDKIVLNQAESTITFSLPGLKIDLGGVAKGYALDQAAKKLVQAGIKSCLINAGGQVYCLGSERGEPWSVAIKDPRGVGVTAMLKLEDESVATSGDYEQFFMAGDKRYAHILDPRTGNPVQNGIESVTIVAKDGLTADVLTTSFFVLGREAGEALIDKYPGARLVRLDTE